MEMIVLLFFFEGETVTSVLQLDSADIVCIVNFKEKHEKLPKSRIKIKNLLLGNILFPRANI